MKITAVDAVTLRIPSAKLPLTEKQASLEVVLVVVHTDDGLRGVGLARGTWNPMPVREAINRTLAPFLLGRDPIDTERVWKDAFWSLSKAFRERAGVVAQAMSAVDQALWDLKGKHLAQPVYRLLGGASDEIDVYTTFGWKELNREELVELARHLVANGHDKLKIQAAAANRGLDIREDVARVRLVREAVGADVKLMLDANSNYDFVNALELTKQLEPYDLTFFEEPIYGADTRLMAELRSRTTVPLTARTPHGSIWTALDLIAGGAVDIAQVNVLDCGGYTECLKMAHMAEMHRMQVAVGGAFYVPNAHLIAGVGNGWMAEYHLMMAGIWDTVLPGHPRPENGRLTMSATPGIGWDLNEAALQEYTVA